MTIKDIAREAGVSITTVSKVMNGRDENISDATRDRVKKVIKDNNYITNAVARGLKTKKTNIIGFVLPDIVNPYYPEIARGIEDAARDRGFGVIFCNTDNSPERELECLQFLKSKMVDGIIYTRTLNGSDAESITNVKTPIVIVDRFVDTHRKKNIGKVFVDVTKAIYESTVKLRKAGCKNIALISSLYTTKSDRYFGYVQAMEDLKLPVCEELIYLDEFNVETGYKGAGVLLEKHKDIDGIVCGNDLIAIGALDMLRENNIRVPEDIKVIGLDNIYLSNFTNPKLSTMEQPTLEVGKTAANMLIDFIKEGKPLYDCVLNHKYIQRESV
ncbi:MAG: LacI family transcriptional regulator [Anaerolineaceae bacterium]|nr:MAG: LacI family transcriptional regulator [Anaerolineaceae bacterium]